MRKKPVLGGLAIVLFLVLYAVAAFAVAYVVYLGGELPQGRNAMYHVYRGDFLYAQIKAGNFYPLYDRLWYNGVEPLRYFPILPAYLFAGLIALVGGSVFDAYYFFLAFLVVLSALPWLFIGLRRNRVWLGGFLGLIWFFIPANLTSLFSEGDFGRALAIALLPILLHLAVRFMENLDFRLMIGFLITYTLMILCHVGFSAMVALAFLIYLLFDKFMNHRRRGMIAVLIGLGIPYLLLGIWFYPSVIGGFLSTSSTRIAQDFFQSGLLSLNPSARGTNTDLYYFGLVLFAFAIFGIITSKTPSMPGFWNGIIIFACSTALFYPLMSRFPGGDYLWMTRFFSIAACFILFAFLVWGSLRTWIVLIVAALLVLDIFPSYKLIYHGNNYYYPESRLTALGEDTMVTEAKSITTQRLAILDASEDESTVHFLTADFGSPVAETYGWGWQAAADSPNVLLQDEALSEGAYLYLFDRLLEMGDDTVLIKKNVTQEEGHDLDYLDSCAIMRGYYLFDQNDEYLIYHYDAEAATWGTTSSYRAIGIGTSSTAIELYYPMMEEGESDNLTDYTFDELKGYEMIYLDHYEYDDLDVAERLVKDLADAGVRIVINADGIPVNQISKVQEFLGVNCAAVKFENGYPFLFVNEQDRYDLNFFKAGYEEWDTVFLNNLDKVTGTFIDNGLTEAFMGTVYNDNITIMGINLIYHFMLTGDPYAGEIVEAVLQLDAEELPERTIVPLQITYAADGFQVDSPIDDVNTTIAYHDMFTSKREIRSINHLLRVDSGKTAVEFHYPYKKQGIALTLLGILLTILFFGVGRIAFEGEIGKTGVLPDDKIHGGRDRERG